MNRKSSARNQPSRSPKDRAPAPKAPDNKRQPSLASLRGEIDRLDLNLVSLLNRRAKLSRKSVSSNMTKGSRSGPRRGKTK